MTQRLLVPLTPQQRANALEFLKRCPLKGAEAPAFTELITLLQSAKPEPPQNEAPAP
jgi:hypothetical protein